MNTVKNFTTIHLRLNLIDVLEVVTLLIAHIIKSSYNLYNVDVSVKNVMYMKKIMFGILLHVVVKL